MPNSAAASWNFSPERSAGMTTTATCYLERFAQYYQGAGIDYLTLAGTHWTLYERMIVPLGPASQDHTISADEQRRLLAHFGRAVLLQYSDGFPSGEGESAWYCVTCHRFLDLGDYTAHFRSMIRRGLKNCMVHKVDADYIARHGYPVYMAAFARYRDTSAPQVAEEAWSRNLLLAKDYPDLREYWAVFVGDQLAGYAGNWLYGKTEVNYSGVKLDPQFLGAYTSYALFFKMNEYYLRDQSFGYANDGHPNIGHQTNIQDFLIQKFGFQRTPTHLHLRYRPWVAAALRIPRFAKRWLGRYSRNYASLCALDDARTRP